MKINFLTMNGIHNTYYVPEKGNFVKLPSSELLN